MQNEEYSLGNEIKPNGHFLILYSNFLMADF